MLSGLLLDRRVGSMQSRLRDWHLLFVAVAGKVWSQQAGCLTKRLNPLILRADGW